MTVREPFSIAGNSILAGNQERFELPVSRLISGTSVALPIRVLHGRDPGPTVWLSAAIHGDELCGVEIIRQVLLGLDPESMRGTVIACPIVNVHGFNTGDRYLPDRRDLNRSFPGSPRGSLAARVANLFMSEVVSRCTVGIDFHTGSDHRTNLPQIRANLDDEATLDLATAFAPPIALHSGLRDGSLRHAGTAAGATVLLFEGGEALRFDRHSISVGRDGTRRALAHLGMIGGALDAAYETQLSRKSRWLRAQRSGILHLEADLGDRVNAGDVIATIVDPFGKRLNTITTRVRGTVIGQRQHPLVHQGDAVSHVAEV